MEDITDYLINREDSIEYKTSDKNVANIETNIKNLLEYIYKDEIYNNYKNGECNSFNDFEVFCINHCKDIEIALGNLEALCDMQRSVDRELENAKQINEEHQKINGELREKVKELIKEKQELTSALLDSIPIQKIEDMFEESQKLYEKKLKEIDFEELKSISLNIFEGIKIEVERDLLRRLLQESEDK